MMAVINFLNKHIGVILFFFIPIWFASFVVLSFIRSKGCVQIVTDSNELRSEIAIRDTRFINCYYDAEKDVRLTIYKLTESVSWLQKQGWVEYYGFSEGNVSGIQFISPMADSEKPSGEQFYIATGKKWGNSWKRVLEKETGMLWIEIQYGPHTLTSVVEKITAVIFPLPILFVALFLFNMGRKIYVMWKRPSISF